MATAKQLAARKKFAEMARSGALAKKRKAAPRKIAAKNPAPRKIIPAPRTSNAEKRFMNPKKSSLPYRVYAEHGGRWGVVAEFRFDQEAIRYAKQYARDYEVRVKVEDES